MKCQHCGTEIPGSAKFCPGCGQNTSRDEASLTSSGDVTVGSPKKTKLWTKILIAIPLVIGVAVAAAFYFTSGAANVVKAHVEALKAKDLEKAYGMTAKRFRTRVTKDEFAKFIAGHKVLADLRELKITSREVKSGGGNIQGTAVAADGSSRTIRYRVRKEDGDWKILWFKIDPGGAK